MAHRRSSEPIAESERSLSPRRKAYYNPDFPGKYQPFPFSPPVKAECAEGDSDLPSADLDLEASFAEVQRVPVMRNTPATHFPQEDTPPSSERLSSPRMTAHRLATSSGEGALIEAAESNDALRCRTLLDEDESLNANCESLDSGWTPLHIAASRGHVRVCEVLLDYGARVDIDCRTPQRQTPLHLAAMAGHKAVVQLLGRSGADITAQDYEGNTPLHISSSRGFGEIVQWLLLRGADVTSPNKSGLGAAEVSISQLLPAFKAQQSPHKPLQHVPIFASRQDEISHLLTKVSDGKSSLSRSHSNPDLAESRTAEKPSTIDFEALYELGRGSFGEVFLVRKLDSGKLYAMKILRKDKILGQNLLKYAMTERNVLSYVEHPFIVKLHYAFQTADKLFLILDYCSRGDLGWHLQREKRFNEYRTRIYMCEIVLAIEELHRRDILFRDLKPDNVLLDEEGHVLLTDFGLSKEHIRDNQLAKSFCGSIAYLAPEMLNRVGHGRAVDWYLLGVLMYEMLVGEPPYYSPNKEQLFHNIQRGKLKLPAFVSQEARSLLLEVIPTQLLQRDPSKRLGSSVRDAEEIKEHRFFYGINWDAVARKELRPPIPQKPTATYTNSSESVLSAGSGVEFSQVEGWSFVSRDVE